MRSAEFGMRNEAECGVRNGECGMKPNAECGMRNEDIPEFDAPHSACLFA